jgi:hypothetical protein
VNENRSPADVLDDADSVDADAAPDPREKPMGFLEHLEELRWTLVKCAVVLAVAATAVGYFLKEFNAVLLWPLRHVQAERAGLTLELSTRSVMESFGIIIQLCGWGGLALAAPFVAPLVAMAAAVALSHDAFDAAIHLGVCDKIVPGLVIAALRFGWIPAIFAPAGPMPSGLPRPEATSTTEAPRPTALASITAER